MRLFQKSDISSVLMPVHYFELSQARILVLYNLEGAAKVADTVLAIVKAGIPVIGHIGMTPQSACCVGRIQESRSRRSNSS